MSPSSTGVQGATAGLGVLSSLFSGLSQREAGIQQQRAYDYNANVDLIDTNERLVANEQQYSELVGRQATAYAAAGVDITRGSPLLMMAATAGRGGRQAEQISEAGNEQATLERYYGQLAAYRGTIGGIGTFLSGLGADTATFIKNTGIGQNVPTGTPLPQDFGGV